jgi:hypothetical protein
VNDVIGLTCTLGCRVASLLMKYLGFLWELLIRLSQNGMVLLLIGLRNFRGCGVDLVMSSSSI